MKKILLKSASKINSIIEVFEDGAKTLYTLKANSKIAPLKNSARETTKKIRDALAPNGLTLQDFSSEKSSTIASLIMGSNVGGGWFLSTCSDISAANPQTTTPKETTPKENESEGFEIIASSTTQEEKEKETTTSEKVENPKPKKEITKKQLEKLIDICERTENLFKEIDYSYQGTPIYNDRIENSFYTSKTIENARAVFYDFALVIGAPLEILDQIEGKINSLEFESIWEDLEALKKENPNAIPHKINNRLDIYFGAGGSGKTTKATRENPNARVISASATQDPSTLFGEFDITSKTFKPSALADAMQNGEKIIIDEFMLYSDEVLERLQAITDEKKIIYDNFLKCNIEIKEGFKIIATMNLLRPLPSALATRANYLNFDKDFKASTRQRLERLLSRDAIIK